MKKNGRLYSVSPSILDNTSQIFLLSSLNQPVAMVTQLSPNKGDVRTNFSFISIQSHIITGNICYCFYFSDKVLCDYLCSHLVVWKS